jgi:hypothetical protein
MSAVKSMLRKYSRFLRILSGLLVLATIVLGVLWYRDPTGNYESLIYVMGTIATLVGGLPSLVEWLTKSSGELHTAPTTQAPKVAKHLPKEAASNEQGDLSVETKAQAPSQPIYGVVERFKQIFTSHGISLTQIPRFIDARFSMSLADLRTDDTLLLKLNDEMLYWVAETFNVRRRWIDGDDERIYATPDYYKCVYKFIDFFVDLLARGYKPEGKRSRSSLVSILITCGSVMRSVSTPRGMKCPQHQKTAGTFRPLERGSASQTARNMGSPSCAWSPRRTATLVKPSLSRSRRSASAGISGAGPRVSGRSKRPASGTGLGTPRR